MKKPHKKSFNWHEASQRFSIRKYHFGAASVLLGLTMTMGAASVVQAETSSELETGADTVTNSSEGQESTANLTTEDATLIQEIRSTETVSQSSTISYIVQYVTEDGEVIAATAETVTVSSSDITSTTATVSANVPSGYALAEGQSSTVTQEVSAGKVNVVTFKLLKPTASPTSSETTPPSQNSELSAQKLILEQNISEALILSTEADRLVVADTDKEALKTATLVTKTSVAEAEKVFRDSAATLEQINTQIESIRTSVGVLALELRKYSKDSEVAISLSARPATGLLNPPEKTIVQNLTSLTDNEVAGIIQNIRYKNPTLDDKDEIIVERTTVANDRKIAGAVTVRYNGDPNVTAYLSAGDTIIGNQAAKNIGDLSKSINWFTFETATITYADGTVAGPADSNGVRQITLSATAAARIGLQAGAKITNTDSRWQQAGVAKYSVKTNQNGSTINNGAKYEVLQIGMKFNVPTKVKGYELTATVTGLAPKKVANDPNRGENAMWDMGLWTEADARRVTRIMNGAAVTGFSYPDRESFPYRVIEVVESVTRNAQGRVVSTNSSAKVALGELDKNGNMVASNSFAPDRKWGTSTAAPVRNADGTTTTVTTSYKKVHFESARAYVENINSGKNLKTDVLLIARDGDWDATGASGLNPYGETERTRNRNALMAFSPSYDTSNVGVSFALSATYAGKPVDVNVIAADAESADLDEFVQFESDGTPWENFVTTSPVSFQGNPVVDPKPAVQITAEHLRTGRNSIENAGYVAEQFVPSNDKVYGDQTFGPLTSNPGKYTLEVGISRNVSNLSIYINSFGAQNGAIGFVVFDGGDAKPSYGSAQHLLGKISTVVNNQEVVYGQPYFGNTAADPDFQSVEADAAYWKLDDVVYTNTYEKKTIAPNTSVKDASGRAGTYTLQANKNAVITYPDGSTKALANNEELVVIDANGVETRGLYNVADKALAIGVMPDEGEKQLLDEAYLTERNLSTKYDIRRASDSEYVLHGVEIHRGQNNARVYVSGWIDFNGNGRFDLNEQSEVMEITRDGAHDISFKNVPQLIDTSQDSVGVRLRIARSKEEILTPTGVASSGEVEDFEAFVTHLPRGGSATTQDVQDRTHTYTSTVSEFFTAKGKVAPDFIYWSEIDKTIAPKIVLTESVVRTATPTARGRVNVTDEDGNTVYIGNEVTLTNALGQRLGTAIQIENPYNHTTEYLLSEYIEYDKQGNKVGTYTLNPKVANNGYDTSGGNARIAIQFDPEPGYVGTANGIAIRAWDANRESTGWEATQETLNASATSSTIAEQDKIAENINKFVNGRFSMDSVYIPRVIDVVPNGEDVTTTDIQGASQSGRPLIPRTGTVFTVDGTKVDYPASTVILDERVPVRFSDIKEEKAAAPTTTPIEVTQATKVILPDGSMTIVNPDAKIPATTTIPGGTEITGEGNFQVDNLWLPSGSRIPAGSTLVARDTALSATTVIRNGRDVVIPINGYIEVGDVLKQDIISNRNNTYNKVSLKKGDVIPNARQVARFVNETDASKVVAIGSTFRSGTETYTARNGIIPTGSYTLSQQPLMGSSLPSAVHLNPATGVITYPARRYTEVSPTRIVIENEGTYTLNQTTGEITFTPHPLFVGVGTGVSVQQPDVDYNDINDADAVTAAYGTDYGRAKYVPTVTPATTATIKRTVHYVYDNDTDPTNNHTTNVANFTQPVVVVDAKPVTTVQSLTFTRDFSYDTNGNLVVSEWRPINSSNQSFESVISPVEPGYSTIVLPQEHRGANQRDVSTFTPAPTTIMSDNSDDIDVYVVYTAEKQYAAVKYWDVFNGTPTLLKTDTLAQTSSLQGYEGQRITYRTQQTIDDYLAAGYQLVYDAYTLPNGRNFDTEKDSDPTNPSQIFNVYLTHKLTESSQPESQEVRRTIKYVDDKGNPVIGANGQPIPDNVEVLTFRRTKFINDVTQAETFGPWTTTSTSDKFATIASPEVPNYTTPNTSVEGTGSINPLAEDQTITVVYTPMTEVVVPPTVKPTDEIPGTNGKTYGQLGLVEEVKLTVHHVYADGSPVKINGQPKVSTETLRYTRTVKLDGNTGEVITATYGEWTPVSQDFAEVRALTKNDLASLEDYTPSVEKVTRTGVIATADDTEVTIIYRTNVKVVNPKDPDNNPNTPTPTTPITPTTPVPNDPKGRTYGDLGVVEEVTLTVHHVYADGKPVMKDGKPVVSTETLTYTRSVQIDAVTGDIIAGTYTDWTPASQNFAVVKALTKNEVATLENYLPSVENVTKETIVATAGDIVETIIYRTNVKVVNPKDPDNNPDTPTPETPITPDTPVPNDPKGRTYGQLGLVEQVKRTVNHIYYDGTPVVGEDGVAKVTTETVTFTRSVQIDSVTGDIIAGTYTAWAPDTQTFAAVPALTKDDVAKLEHYKANVEKVGTETVSATDADRFATIVYNAANKIVDPKNPDNTPTTPITPTTPVPNDPKGRTYGQLGLIEEVMLTVYHVYADGKPVMKDGQPVVSRETLTYTRAVQVDAVTGDIIAGTYTDWTPASQNFAEVRALTKNDLAVLENYLPSVESVTKTNVVATDKDTEVTIIYRTNVKVVNPKDPDNNPNTPTPTTPITPTTPVPNDPKGRTYGDLGVVEEVTLTVHHVYADGKPVMKDGKPVVSTETLTYTRSVQIDAVTGDIIAGTYTDWTPASQNFAVVKALTKNEVATLENYLPSVENVTKETIVATAGDIVETIIYRTNVKVVNPKDPDNNPDTPTPDMPITPTTSVPNDPKGRTYGDLGVVEEVTLTVHHVYADGSPVMKDGQPVVSRETLTFTRTVQVDAETGDIIAGTYTDWAPATQDFKEVLALTKDDLPALDKFKASVSSVAKTGVTATDKDVETTIIYKTVDAPQIVITPPTDETLDPNKPVPNDPKGRTYGQLGLVEQVKRTVNHIYYDGTPVVGEDGVAKVTTETVTFTRSVTIDSETGNIIAGTYTDWTPATQDFAAVPALTKDDVAKLEHYKANVEEIGAETVAATDADRFATIVYKAVNKVVDPKDPSNPTTPVTPTTPVPKDPKGRTYGDLGLVEEVTLTVHHVYANDGKLVMKDGQPVVSRETLTFTRTVQVDAVTGDIIVGTYTDWTPASQDFKEVYALTKNEVASLENYSPSVEKVTKTGVSAIDKDADVTILYRPKQSTVTPPTDVTVTPDTPVPNDPKGRTYGQLGLVEQVKRTVNHIYYDGTPVVGEDGVAKVTTETVTFTRSVQIDSVTGDIIAGTYTAWAPDTQTFVAVPALTKDDVAKLEHYKANVDEVGTETVSATDADRFATIVYNAVNKVVDPKNPDNTPTTPITPTTPVPNDPKGRTYGDLGLVEQVRLTVHHVYADGKSVMKDGIPVVSEETLTFTRTVQVDAVTGDIIAGTYTDWTPATQDFKEVPALKLDNYVSTVAEIVKTGVVATDKDENRTIIYNPIKNPVDPTKPIDDDNDPNTPPIIPTKDTLVPNDPKGRTYGELGLIDDVTRIINYIYTDGTIAVPSHTETVTFTRTATVDAVTGEVVYTSNFVSMDSVLDEVVSPVLKDHTPNRSLVEAKEVQASDRDFTETVIYTADRKTVTPPTTKDEDNNPTTPETPVSPDDKVPNDPKGRTYAELGLVEQVTRTISYVYGNGSKAAEPVVETLTFVRSVDIDAVTGDIISGTYTAWKSVDDTFDAVSSPEISGFVASRLEIPAKVVTATSDDSAETVIYVDPVSGSQVAVTHFVDETGNAVHISVVEAGEDGTSLTKQVEVETVMKQLENMGYEVVENGYPTFDADATNDVFDTVSDVDAISQVYHVRVRPILVPTNPEDPDNNPDTPDTPANPDDKVPGDPKGRTYAELGLIESVTRTITYIYDETGEPVLNEDRTPKVVTQTVNFYRTAQINKVTGEVTITSDWTAPQELAAVDSPVLKGYLVKQDVDKVIEAKTVAYNAQDITEVVEYIKLGSWVPQLPTGEKPVDPSTNTPVEPIVYPNDPNNPTKPGTDVPTVPYIPGYTPAVPTDPTKPVGPTNPYVPLTPVDPTDPTKGYTVPPVPSNPGDNTPITYVPNIPVNPEDPDNNPDTPDTPATPDTKVPNDPKGRTYGELGLIESVTRTITYVYKDGTPVRENGVAKVVTQTVNFYRTAILDGVTGDAISMGDWTAPQTLVAVKSPVIKKYLADKATVAEATVAYNAADLAEEVVYTPLGSWVPQLPTGEKPVDPSTNKPVDPIVYPNDPNDPTKPGTDVPTVPYIPGYVPVDPKTDKPLQPVDPTDPTKGYKAPPVPSNPGEDTEIPYQPNGSYVPVIEDPRNPIPPVAPAKVPYDTTPENPSNNPPLPYVPGYVPVDPKTDKPLQPADPNDLTKGYIPPSIKDPNDPRVDTPVKYIPSSQSGTVKFVDTTTNTVKFTENLTGNAGDEFGFDPADKIKEFEKLGYTVVNKDNYDKSGTFDRVDGNSQDFFFELTPKVTPISPDKPGKPGEPIAPTNPEGPKWPTDQGVDDVTRTITRTVTYVDATGKEVAAGSSNSVTFTRTGEINHVTGEVTWTDWTTTDAVLEGTKNPVVKGYIAKSATADGKDVDLTTVETNQTVTQDSENINEVVTYVKLGSWVPQLPTGEKPVDPSTNTPVDPIVYPNNPTDPSKPGTDVPTIPYIPGYVPVDPKTDKPLQPVDPTDPTKGYKAPPVPSNPGEDTEIPYQPNGSYVPVIEDPRNPIPPVAPAKVPYDTTPENPSNNPPLPYVPGYVPVDPKTDKPLQPADPNDLTKGYIPPSIKDPNDPRVDTPVKYIPSSQSGTVKFVDTTTNTVKFTENLTGNAGDEFGFDPADKIKEFEKLGYTVVNKDNYDKSGTFDRVDGNSQDFFFELTPKVTPITPDKPGKPGEPIDPIDPTNPEGPKWPTDKGVDDVTRTINRSVSYVVTDKDGNIIETPAELVAKSNSVTFTRTGEINHVTGEVTWTDWTTTDAVLEGTKNPVVKGYIAKSATADGKDVDLTTVETDQTVTQDSANINEVVTYVKLGSWVPQLPTGEKPVDPNTGKPVDPIVYPNDPTDPSKPGTDVPTVPYIPGYVPVDPNGTPLKPVDPTDPTKGYIAPPVPSNPGEDTPISYVPEKPSKPTKPATPKPGKPVVPEVPVKPTETEQSVVSEVSGESSSATQQQLPNTGEERAEVSYILGASAMLMAAALVDKRRKEEE